MSSTEPNKYSIEFYPPRAAEGEAKLDIVHAQLAKLNPDFFSVTYGAGGSTKKGTCLLYTSPSPRDATLSRMPSSA